MNYKKYILFALLAVLFLSSGLYNKHNNIDFMSYNNDPDGHDNKEIGIAGTIISRTGDSLLISDSMYGKKVIVKSVYENWYAGQFVNLWGTYHKEGYIEFKRGELIWNRKIKLILSAFGMLFFLYILYKDYKKLRFSL